MNISPINNNQTNFNGKIITKGHWTNYLENAFVNNPEVKKMASGDKNIIGKMSHRYASRKSFEHFKGEELFKLSISTEKENPTFMDKVKSFLRLSPKVNLSKHYHSEIGTHALMRNRIDAGTYGNKLDLKY